MLYGVDVHDGYQAGLSFTTLARQGYSFAAVKLTQGTGYVRSRAASWIAAAKAAGLIPGAYHWLTAGDGAAQARWFHQHVTAAGGPKGLLIQLDCEDDGYAQPMTAFAREWEQLSGGHPLLIYSGGWWWPRTGGFKGAGLTPYLWHSHYLTPNGDPDSVPDDPAAFARTIPASWWSPGYGGWSTATILQFTSRGDAGGLANNVDLNVTRLDRAGLLALTTSGGGGGGGDMPLTQDDLSKIGTAVWSATFGSQTASARLFEILVNTRKLNGDLVDERAIAAEVLAQLTPQAIADAIPDTLSAQVADLLAARLVA